ncbi:MAG: hypothetical protein KAR38_11675 [Calditrichia bacterium]|nr:hypothetical protein [Calditrichia bacterium]
MKTNEKKKNNFEELDSPEDMELKETLKKISKILGIFWGLCFVVLIIVPLFDFSLNQAIVSFAYYSIVIGLIYFLFLEFNFELIFRMFKKIYRSEKR